MIHVLAAEIGATALLLLYLWLISAAAAGWLSHRKGYGERPGLASGLFLTLIGVVVWLVWPPREDSLWKKVGPFGRPKAGDIKADIADHAGDGPAKESTSSVHAQDAAAAGGPTSGDVAPPSSDTTERP